MDKCKQKRVSTAVIAIIISLLSAPLFSTTSLSYTYDSLGRLGSATRSDGSSVTYSYDNVGNVVSQVSELPADTDGDKLPDAVEVLYGLNASLADTDGDGVSDHDEVCFDGNCGDYNPFDASTNPTGTDLDANKVDTDGDGYADILEINANTNPLSIASFPSGSQINKNNHYTVLNPGLVGTEAWVVSLSDNNAISAGGTVLLLNKYERGQIPAGVLLQGMPVSGTGPFDIGSSADATDVPLSSRMAGTAFVVPHLRNTHWYYLMSPSGDATAQVNANGVVTTLLLSQGQVVEFNAGFDARGTAIITSDLSILVAHRGDAGSTLTDASPVPPAALELWGVRTQNTAYLGALEDNTTVSIYADDGTSVTNVVLNAGQRYSINAVGTGGTQSTGSGLRIVADKPVGAIQIADGDGADQTAFLPTSQLGTRFGLPTDTQYVAVVCPTANTTVILYNGINPPQSRLCSASGTSPGKVYFGAVTNGTNIGAGAYLEADQPVYLIYEDALSDDEHNLMGLP